MKKALLIILSAVLLSESTAGSANTQPDSGQLMKNAQVALAAGEYETAFTGYAAAARNDQNALAQFSLGLFYQNGWGRPIDKITACQWFEKSAQGGIPVAQHLTGVCFDEGTHRPADPVAAASWFQKAAQAGHFHSYCHLGNLLMTGRGTPKDPLKALELCHPAAQQGSIPAQLWLGKFYLQGDPSIQDRQEAYRWFSAAAQKQAPEAFYYLGIMMHQGALEGHIPEKTRKMFEQAATLNYVPAYFQAGKHFFAAEPDPQTNQLPAEHLAKAYLWISVAIQRSEDAEELLAAQSIRQQILAIMPETWLAELDQKVAQHLQRK